MIAEERCPAPGAQLSRRSLFAAGAAMAVATSATGPANASELAAVLAGPTIVATASSARAAPQTSHDEPAWRRLVAEYERRQERAKVCSGPDDEAQQALFEAKREVEQRAAEEAAPPEIMLTFPDRIVEADSRRIILEGWSRPADSRSELLSLRMEDPTQRFRLDAWDAWKARQAAHQKTPAFVQVERRARILRARWEKANQRAGDAAYDLLAFPTLAPDALTYKLRLSDELGWEEDGHSMILQACFKAVGATWPA